MALNDDQPSNSPAGRSSSGNSEDSASPWSPLRREAFRAIWIALIVSNIGTWMQTVGAAWLMTALSPSPLLVALMQTAVSLPIFVLGLPAGTLADLIDRRKLLLATAAWSLLIALLLGVLTQIGLIADWSLLTLTFLLGIGGALNAPAWQAIVPELVEREELPAAVALQAMGFNVARIEARAFAFQQEGVAPVAAHLIAAHAYNIPRSTRQSYLDI